MHVFKWDKWQSIHTEARSALSVLKKLSSAAHSAKSPAIVMLVLPCITALEAVINIADKERRIRGWREPFDWPVNEVKAERRRMASLGDG